MNVGLAKRNIARPNKLSLARIYMKDGQIRNIPLRKARPDYQFMNWFRHQSRAMSGFPVSIKSVLWIDNQGLCPDCQERVRNYLGRFRLSNAFRVIQPNNDFVGDYPQDNCKCQHQNHSFEPIYDDFELNNISNEGFSLTGTGQLSTTEKDKARDAARSQYYTKMQVDEKNPKHYKNTLKQKGVEVNHRIPLEYVDMLGNKKTATDRNNPNRKNLQALPVAVHGTVSNLWSNFTGSKTAANIRKYALGVDRVLQAKKKEDVETALNALKKVNPNLNVKDFLSKLVTNGKSNYWTSSFLQKNPAWLNQSKVFGKELEAIFQEMYVQELGEM